MKRLIIGLALLATGCGQDEANPEPTMEQRLEQHKDDPMGHYQDGNGKWVAFKDTIVADIPRDLYPGEYELIKELGECFSEGVCVLKRVCYLAEVAAELTCLHHEVWAKDGKIIQVDTYPAD